LPAVLEFHEKAGSRRDASVTETVTSAYWDFREIESLPRAGGTFTLNAQIGSGREGRRMGVQHVSK